MTESLAQQITNRRLAYLVLAGLVLLADQVTKRILVAELALGEVRTIIPEFFRLTHTRNRGAAFGLFADLDSPWISVFLSGFAVVALVLVLTLLWRNHNTHTAAFGLGLILGGAAGNLIDRLQTGSVVDFLEFHIGQFYWPAFNVADSAIVVGAAALIFHVLRPSPEEYSRSEA